MCQWVVIWPFDPAVSSADPQVKPGSVPKVHRTRMVFKQMENIGRFLDAARQYGVSSSDLFTTVDLFENAVRLSSTPPGGCVRAARPEA